MIGCTCVDTNAYTCAILLPPHNLFIIIIIIIHICVQFHTFIRHKTQIFEDYCKYGERYASKCVCVCVFVEFWHSKIKYIYIYKKVSVVLQYTMAIIIIVQELEKGHRAGKVYEKNTDSDLCSADITT